MPSVYSDTLTHDAVLVFLSRQDRDAVVGVQMRTAPPPVVGDDVTVLEAVTVRVGLALAVADDTPVDDAITDPGLGLPVRAVDALAPGEAVEGRVSVLLPAVGDDRPAAEALTLALFLPGVAVVDSLSPTDVVALRASLAVEDSVTPGELAVVVLPTAPTAVDVVAPTEAVALALNVLTLAIVDAVPVGEQVSPLANVALEVADAIVLEERRFVVAVKPKKVKIRPTPGQGQG